MSVPGHDPALLADDSALLHEPAQETRIERRVEVEGIRDRRQRVFRLAFDVREAVAGKNDRVQEIMAERLGKAERPRAQPILMERQKADPAAHLPERVDVSLVRSAPTVECDAELVGRASCGNEL